MKNIQAIIFVLCFVFLGCLWAQTDKPSQRMVLILKEPIESKAINVKVNKDLETSGPFQEEEKPIETFFEESHKVFLEKGRANRYTLTLDLIQGGYVKLEARDFGGKKISVLFEDFLSKGKYVFEENESWEDFKNLKGITFIALYIDGKQVLKKLVAKVD